MKYLSGKKNCAVDFLSRYHALRASPDILDADQDEELQVAMVSATVMALDESDCTIDEEMVLKAVADDPVYQLPVASVLADDWHPQKLACLCPFYNVRVWGLIFLTMGACG